LSIGTRLELFVQESVAVRSTFFFYLKLSVVALFSSLLFRRIRLVKSDVSLGSDSIMKLRENFYASHSLT
jgi:hypothetical protein